MPEYDHDATLARLQAWVECESPTWDAAAVDRMGDLAERDLAGLGAVVERIPGRLGFGGCVRARFPHANAVPGHESVVPGVLVLAHLDTVHPVGTLDALPWRREGGRAWGPGVLDMKGGTVLTLEAMRMLDGRTPLPVTILLTSDEEVGSPSTRALIEAEARRAVRVLVPEPALSGGGVVTGRYAIARFNLRATGRPSHAGARLADGRSAIAEMARQVVAVEDMTTESCTFSVGVIRGGQWVNCVASSCDAEVLSMAKRQADLDAGVARMLALPPLTPGAGLQVSRGVTRPVWEPDEGTMALFERARALSGGQLARGSAGGGSDGNFTGAMGVPTLDGLGPEGAGYHTFDEHVLEASLPVRARLLAGLLATE